MIDLQSAERPESQDQAPDSRSCAKFGYVLFAVSFPVLVWIIHRESQGDHLQVPLHAMLALVLISIKLIIADARSSSDFLERIDRGIMLLTVAVMLYSIITVFASAAGQSAEHDHPSAPVAPAAISTPIALTPPMTASPPPPSPQEILEKAQVIRSRLKNLHRD